MTQLLIAGIEVVLPQDFSVSIRRENSFFTKNGQYTYDCTLHLNNRVTSGGVHNATNVAHDIDFTAAKRYYVSSNGFYQIKFV